MFSIVMPAYNSAETIGVAIDSVLSQTYQNWELIIIDDGSTDATNSIVDGYRSRDARIKRFANHGDKGAAGARSTGVSLSSQRYISFLDSDDLWLSWKLERQAAFLISSGARFVYSNYFVFEGGWSDYKEAMYYVAPSKINFRQMLRSCPIGCLTVSYDSHYFGKLPFPKTPKEDYALWLQLLTKVDFAYNDGGIVGCYRIGRSSLSSNKLLEILRQKKVLESIGHCRFIEKYYCLLTYIFRGVFKYKNLNKGMPSYSFCNEKKELKPGYN